MHDFLLDLGRSRVLPERYRSQKEAVQKPSTDSTASTEVAVAAPLNTTSSPSTASSPGSCPELTKELIASFAQQGTIMLTVSHSVFEAGGPLASLTLNATHRT